MSDPKPVSVLLTCDRTEGGVAVLLTDEGEQITVFPPLSDALCEGGVYHCVFQDGTLLSAERDEDEEARRKAASAALRAKLFGS